MTCDKCRHYFHLPHTIKDKPCDGWCCRYPLWQHKNKDTNTCGEFKLPPKPIKQKRIESYSPEFDQFYAAYPKKKAPDAAWRAWQAIPPQHYPLIVERAKVYAQSVTGKDMTYVKHPATWLNSGAWKEITENKVGPKDCSFCYAPYSPGHKFSIIEGKKVYKCAKCREKGKLF